MKTDFEKAYDRVSRDFFVVYELALLLDLESFGTVPTHIFGFGFLS